MGVLSGNPKNEPLHYGEVFAIWTALMGCKVMIGGYQTLLNHVGDKDLKRILEEAIELAKTDSKGLEDVLKINGINLPPAPPERPLADLEDIPAGAKFYDQEIAAKLSIDIAAGLVACSQTMGMCNREDIAMMFGQMHMSKAQLGAKILRLNKEKGWLIPPPLHLSAPEQP
ncbi:DUF3231 family protein [Siminovitchia sp. FSL W7-1587]|uniref:DUF3231 family protein n=1 Tax=Siminovitchia sp. FSL W7-1587 TaxID=2954699 RepID=UPI0030CBAA41